MNSVLPLTILTHLVKIQTVQQISHGSFFTINTVNSHLLKSFHQHDHIPNPVLLLLPRSLTPLRCPHRVAVSATPPQAVRPGTKGTVAMQGIQLGKPDACQGKQTHAGNTDGGDFHLVVEEEEAWWLSTLICPQEESANSLTEFQVGTEWVGFQ